MSHANALRDIKYVRHDKPKERVRDVATARIGSSHSACASVFRDSADWLQRRIAHSSSIVCARKPGSSGMIH